MITAETITDEQIRELRESLMNGAPLAESCDVALGDLALDGRDMDVEIEIAHERCAEALNRGAVQVTALHSSRQPIPILHSRSLSSQRLIRALDAILDLGHSEIDLRIGTRSELIAWAGLHGLTVETSEMGEHQLTRVLHKDRIQTLAMLMEVVR